MKPSPHDGLETTARLLDAAGFSLPTELEPKTVADSHMLSDVARILRLTPEQRFLEIANISRLEARSVALTPDLSTQNG